MTTFKLNTFAKNDIVAATQAFVNGEISTPEITQLIFDLDALLESQTGVNYQTYFTDEEDVDQQDLSLNAVVLASTANMNITTGSGHDYIHTGSGKDNINSGSGNDIIYSSSGRDTVDAGNGNDVVYGENGNDTIKGNRGNDHLYGGNGNDVVKGGNGSDLLVGGNGKDKLYGGNNNDFLLGDSGDDKLYGGNGNDYLFGGTGNDTLDGGAGNDVLYTNEQGRTDITTGKGADVIDVTASNAITNITVRDFSVEDGDVIDISNVISTYDLQDAELDDLMFGLSAGDTTFISLETSAQGTGFDGNEIGITLYGVGMTVNELIDAGAFVV